MNNQIACGICSEGNGAGYKGEQLYLYTGTASKQTEPKTRSQRERGGLYVIIKGAPLCYTIKKVYWEMKK